MIVNSDSLPVPDFDLADQILTLRPGHAIVAKRVDVANIRQLAGSQYPYGFDFFALHVEDARRLDDLGFIYGMPWWDNHVVSCVLWTLRSP